MKIKLTNEEQDAIIRNRASGVPAADRTGFVGIVNFCGPRGRRYRPIRTAVFLDLDSAIAAITEIRHRQYAHGAFPVSDDVIEVDATGAEVE